MNRILSFALLIPAMVFANNIDAVVAVINDEVITQSDLNYAIKQEEMFNSEHLGKITEQQVLEFLINESILYQQSKLMNMSINRDELASIIENFAKNNNQTLESLKEVIVKQGQTMAQFSKKLERQVLAMRAQNALMTASQKPTEGEIRNFYEQHKADALMISFKDWVFSDQNIPKDWNKQKPTVIDLTYVKSLPPVYQKVFIKNPFAKQYGPIKAENGYHMVEVSSWQGELMPKSYALNILMMKAIEAAKPEIIEKLKKNIYLKVYK